MKIHINGISMNYELTGEGRCVVLIHGFGDNLQMWYNQVPELSERYQVLSYDVRGFGLTEKTTGAYSIDLFTRDLYELLGALEIRSACLLGFSMGGRIALEFALTYPDMTTGLILANSGVETSPKPEMAKHRQVMESILQQGQIETISAIMTRGSFSPGFRKNNPAAFKRCMDIRMQNDPVDYLEIMGAVDEALDAPVDLGRLECPVLMIAGDGDALMGGSVAEDMKRAIGNAILKILPTGHLSAIEDPEKFNREVLNFMQDLQWRE
jgi:pimeloyl-ACP methyl ester carboxylesterase